MPLGAVLAGRLLAGPLLRSFAAGRWFRGGTAVVAAGYLAAMAYGAAQPSIPSANQQLASWLSAHDLTGGLAAYWQAGSVTLDTGGKVALSGVIVAGHGRLGPYYWETKTSDYDPRLHRATFVVAGGPASVAPAPGLAAAAVRTFGPPAHIYHVGQYTILTWPRNILRQLG
jgi:hypothetical protein